MKITINSTQRIPFERVPIGATFIDNLGFGDDEVLMRIDCCPNIVIVDSSGNGNYIGYAVNFTNGKIYGYKAFEKVYLAESELVATR